MKRFAGFYIVILSLLFLQCTGKSGKSTGTSENTGTPEMVFAEYEHDFGKVAGGEKISYQFRFDNKGTGDLVIASVMTTCGCTVTKYDRKPVPPGGSGSIEAVFDTSGRDGMQTKTITVNSNASVPVILLKIIAEVEQEK
jgi:hypothetical protein